MQAAEITIPTVPCPKCSTGLAEPAWTAGSPFRCPVCNTNIAITGFPALVRPDPDSESGERAADGDAACFFHPEKRASVVCDQCGRFICPLCDLPIGSRHLCPTCLESGLEKQERMIELVSKRICWGRLSLFLGTVIPLLMFPLTPLSASGAVFCGIYGWNKPGSLVKGRQRIAATFGILLGILQLLAFVGVCALAWRKVTR